MENPKIIAYLKPHCGWSQGVRAVLGKYRLSYEDRDIWNDPAPAARNDSEERAGTFTLRRSQRSDVGRHQRRGTGRLAHSVGPGLPEQRAVDVPINAPCADHGEVISTPITLKR
ncbi:MAG: glutaredoxin domain-containing protein [Verrucomicrobiota bacterium]